MKGVNKDSLTLSSVLKAVTDSGKTFSRCTHCDRVVVCRCDQTKRFRCKVCMDFPSSAAYASFMRVPIADLEEHGISLRIVNHLEEDLACITLGDLVQKSRDELAEVDGIGPKSVQLILDAVHTVYEQEFGGGSGARLEGSNSGLRQMQK